MLQTDWLVRISGCALFDDYILCKIKIQQVINKRSFHNHKNEKEYHNTWLGSEIDASGIVDKCSACKWSFFIPKAEPEKNVSHYLQFPVTCI